jgi:hypothetical protein
LVLDRHDRHLVPRSDQGTMQGESMTVVVEAIA